MQNNFYRGRQEMKSREPGFYHGKAAMVIIIIKTPRDAQTNAGVTARETHGQRARSPRGASWGTGMGKERLPDLRRVFLPATSWCGARVCAQVPRSAQRNRNNWRGAARSAAARSLSHGSARPCSGWGGLARPVPAAEKPKTRAKPRRLRLRARR